MNALVKYGKPGFWRLQVEYVTINGGDRRTFTITVRLSEGYENGVVHHSSRANQAIKDWMEARAEDEVSIRR